jgi:hypothetical protein
MEEPEIAEQIYQLLYMIGAIPAQGGMPDGGMPTGPAPAPAASPTASGLWTPDSEAAATGTGKLWTPD